GGIEELDAFRRARSPSLWIWACNVATCCCSSVMRASRCRQPGQRGTATGVSRTAGLATVATLKSLVSGKPGNQADTMAADKDVELVEVTHSVSIPIIRARKTFGQVYRQKYLTTGGGRRQNQGERLRFFFAPFFQISPSGISSAPPGRSSAIFPGKMLHGHGYRREGVTPSQTGPLPPFPTGFPE